MTVKNATPVYVYIYSLEVQQVERRRDTLPKKHHQQCHIFFPTDKMEN